MTLSGAEIRIDKLGCGGGILRQRYCEAKVEARGRRLHSQAATMTAPLARAGLNLVKILKTGGTNGFQWTLVAVMVATREQTLKAH